VVKESINKQKKTIMTNFERAIKNEGKFNVKLNFEFEIDFINDFTKKEFDYEIKELKKELISYLKLKNQYDKYNASELINIK